MGEYGLVLGEYIIFVKPGLAHKKPALAQKVLFVTNTLKRIDIVR
jgi:hypothetical protein